MEISCDRCREEYWVTADQEGATHACPRCGAPLYVPQGASQYNDTSRRARWLRIAMPPQAVPVGSVVAEPHAGLGGVERRTRSSVAVPWGAQEVSWLVAGWLALCLALILRFAPTPTTVVLSWVCTALAIGAAIGLLVLRRVGSGSTLLVFSVLVPAVMSLLFWSSVAREVETEVRRAEAAISAVDRNVAASMKQLNDSLSRASRSLLSPTSAPAQHWDAARRKVRIGGVGKSGGREYVLVNNQFTYDGAEVNQAYGGHLYRWRVRVHGDDVRLDRSGVSHL